MGMTGQGISRLGLLALIPAALAVAALVHGYRTDPFEPWVPVLPWSTTLGVDLTLNIDGLALLFILLICGIGALVFVYAAAYMAGVPDRARLFVLLLLFMLSMLGAVSTDHLIALFVFWEMTSLTSFLLVGFKHEDEESRRSAQQALFVTGGGGLVMLAGLILLAEIGGSYSIRALIASHPAWIDDARVPVALALIFVGAFAKSAQFPFHFWLPNAMSAPTPVSAYLHSATMVKLGVYLLARLHPAFGELPMWQMTLTAVGGFTAALAMVLTLRERDLKRILAWSTVAALGTLVMLIGVPGDGAPTAAMAFLLAHALYKAPLFFVAGNIDHATGTRRIDQLAGLAPVMPWSAAAALLAGLSMAGMPLSFGFVAKDMMSIAKADDGGFVWVGYASLFVSAVSVAVAAVAAIRVFWHRGGREPSDVHEGGWGLFVPALLIAVMGVALGLVPHLVDPLIRAAANAMLPGMEPPGLVFDPTDRTVLGTLAVAVAAGGMIYLFWDRLHAQFDRFPWLDRVSSVAIYHALVAAIPKAAAVTPRLQSGSLVGYTVWLLLAATVALIAALAAATWVWPAPELPSLAVAGASALLVVAALAACLVRDSFVLLLSAGLVGFGSALLFLFLGAPDLAFTQFAVEVAFVVVIAAILLRVRRLDLVPAGRQRAWPRIVVAVAFGSVAALLLLLAVADPLDPTLAQYFGERALLQAHGRNVVNVVLVDFRAVDTMGEIAVVTTAFVAALPLLRLAYESTRRAPASDGERR
jgi:multicomponent Na+:H+ antiporter subunit A